MLFLQKLPRATAELAGEERKLLGTRSKKKSMGRNKRARKDKGNDIVPDLYIYNNNKFDEGFDMNMLLSRSVWAHPENPVASNLANRQRVTVDPSVSSHTPLDG